MKRIRLIIILVALAVLGFLAVAIFRDREPRYEGRTLTEWIESVPRDYIGSLSDYKAHEDPARRALQHMAPEAIPILLKWLQLKDSAVMEELGAWLNYHPSLHFHIRTPQERKVDAMYGFQLLGPAAKPAWPALIRLTHAKNGIDRILALLCLSESKAPKEILLPVLLDMIHDSDRDVQKFATTMFRSRYPQDAKSFTNQPPTK